MKKRTALDLLVAALAITDGLSQAQAAPPAALSVDLSNFKFTPSRIELSANVPIVVQLRNDSSGGHNFSAPAFFAAAHVDRASAGFIHDGRVEVPAHASVRIALTPTAGRYPVRCTHAFHGAFGMKGTITVR